MGTEGELAVGQERLAWAIGPYGKIFGLGVGGDVPIAPQMPGHRPLHLTCDALRAAQRTDVLYMLVQIIAQPQQAGPGQLVNGHLGAHQRQVKECGVLPQIL